MKHFKTCIRAKQITDYQRSSWAHRCTLLHVLQLASLFTQLHSIVGFHSWVSWIGDSSDAAVSSLGTALLYFVASSYDGSGAWDMAVNTRIFSNESTMKWLCHKCIEAKEQASTAVCTRDHLQTAAEAASHVSSEQWTLEGECHRQNASN